MGLIGLVGGGQPGFDYTVAGPSSRHFHPYGTRAQDSSGGVYLYAKASTAASSCSMVRLTPGADPWQATAISSGADLSSVQGNTALVQISTANSTTQDVWLQLSGPATVLGDSSGAGLGKGLFLSTSIAGALSVTTTGLRIPGAYTASSNTSSLWSVMLPTGGIAFSIG